MVPPKIIPHALSSCTLSYQAHSNHFLFIADAWPHQQSSPAACSTGGGQPILVGFSADETGGGDGPWITSACHCSSTVSSRQARMFRMPRWSVRICNG